MNTLSDRLQPIERSELGDVRLASIVECAREADVYILDMEQDLGWAIVVWIPDRACRASYASLWVLLHDVLWRVVGAESVQAAISEWLVGRGELVATPLPDPVCVGLLGNTSCS